MAESPAQALDLILVTHDSARWLPAFFASWRETLANTRILKTCPVRLIVADSASQDDSPAVAGQLDPQATILACPHIGFGAAANRAAAAGNAPWLLICNPDLTFLPDFAPKLLDPLLLPLNPESPPWHGAACIAPRVLNPDRSLQPSIGRFPSIASLVGDQLRPRPLRKYAFPQPANPGMVDWATGACLLFKRAWFADLGGFDEKYFLYMEEVDLQRRLWDRGCQTWFAPEAAVIHHAPNATKAPRREIQCYAARGTLRYFAKFCTPTQLLAYRLLAFISGRLSFHEATAARPQILATPTGPN